MESFEILKIAANALNDKKAKDISAVKIDTLTILTEYFLICTGTSSTQIRALCDEVEEKLEEAGVRPHHIEGRSSGWIVLDYGSVIIHIFGKNEREFFSLDKMWSDGEPVNLDEILTSSREE
ncbi:MAG: ribosome silencing factor [Acutalibacteraceae bacterium]|jgi:ribosome-associated protein